MWFLILLDFLFFLYKLKTHFLILARRLGGTLEETGETCRGRAGCWSSFLSLYQWTVDVPVSVPACVSWSQQAEALVCTAPVCRSPASLDSQFLWAFNQPGQTRHWRERERPTQAWSPRALLLFKNQTCSCLCSKIRPFTVGDVIILPPPSPF